MLAIEIADKQTRLPIDRKWFRALTRHVLQAEGVAAARLSLAFVEDAAIHQLNRQYLGHDFATDVITFPLSDSPALLQGELVISTEYALAAARKYRRPAHVEAGLYLVHGVLHLCGYNDLEEEEASAMRRRQNELLRAFLRRPAGGRYVERTGRISTRSN